MLSYSNISLQAFKVKKHFPQIGWQQRLLALICIVLPWVCQRRKEQSNGRPKQMRFPYIRRRRNHISRVVSFPGTPRPVPNWSQEVGADTARVTVARRVAARASLRLGSAPRWRSAFFPLRRLIWCICKQHYRWKRFRRCLASINPICVLTHFRRACRCTHEMRGTQMDATFSKDFGGHKGNVIAG